MTSILEVVWTTRSGGRGCTERRFLDFVVNGVALSSLLDTESISPFGWFDVNEQDASIDRLLGKSPPDVAQGRTTLYICPECGDLGCGAVTLLVQVATGAVIWRDFGVQNNYEDVVRSKGFEGIGPFTFDLDQYNQLFERVRRSKEGAD